MRVSAEEWSSRDGVHEMRTSERWSGEEPVRDVTKRGKFVFDSRADWKPVELLENRLYRGYCPAEFQISHLKLKGI